MRAQCTFLGTGSSMGVPVIGCKCNVCKGDNPKNRRTRAGVLIESQEKKILIDASPDIRQQALLRNIDTIDGFILTHSHYDHVGGFDDLKVYKKSEEEKLPCLMLEETFKELQEKYHYFIHPKEEDPVFSPFFSWHILPGSGGKTVFVNKPFTYLSFFQCKMKVLGVRMGNLAYLSDIKTYKEDIFSSLQGVEVLILSALRQTKSPMHFSIEEALSFAEKVHPKRVYFTHIAHETDHDLVQALLPDHVQLAYDGLSFSFDWV